MNEKLKKKKLFSSCLSVFICVIFCSFCLGAVGCGQEEDSLQSSLNEEVAEEILQKQLSWQITDGGAEITYGEESESFYRITQLPFPTFWGGAAYSIRTPDGDLYLVDGGFQGEDGERIAQYIEENGGKVKGWMLTHPHVDHIGAFLDYASLHPEKIEKVYYAPFTREFFEEEEDPEIYQIINNAILFYEFLEVQEETKEQIEYIPMEVGDILLLEELKLECFASFDPMRKDVNGNSLVFTLSYEEFTLLLTADMTEATLEAMKMAAEETASLWDVDVIQIPHHGYAGGITTESLYTATGAKLALLDCTKEEYENNSAAIQNTIQLLEKLDLPYLPRFQGENGTEIYLYE
ncbi:MAG: MBL fold metallo-hydrolase [Lachnospiraceae bacterium]|nr:MBL fold metallo-hydrolase [Lachnospiraceae bacterium]